LKARAAGDADTFNLSDFGAVGDGQADDGPALQQALDALAAAGGGTLLVPAGHYAIVTPVARDFGGLASVTIQGVESDAAVPPPTSEGTVLSQGLSLTSEFLPRTGDQQAAVSISGARSLLVRDVAFVGTPGVDDDALVTLDLNDVADATVHHCEFYALGSFAAGGAILRSVRGGLKIEESEFLGCATNSAVYGSVVQNLEWKSVAITDAVFIDYGQRPELFGKLDLGTPFSWVALGNAAPTTADSPRREAALRSVFFDEGAMNGLSSLPDPQTSAPIDLVYVTGLFMNVSNLGTSGHYLYGLQGVMVENSFYGWSQNADSAINILGASNVILDRVVCDAAADTIRADAATASLTVIGSTYDTLDSQAQQTNVLTPATPDDDPVQYVRSRFQDALGREPDAAAHFYWSDQLLRCAAAGCVSARRAALDSYLASAPQPTFTLSGFAHDENGSPIAGVAVTLSGSQSATTQTGPDGSCRFDNLPTSGVYTLNAGLRHYTFASPVQTFTTPAADLRADFATTINRHQISGRLTDETGRAIAGATVTLSGAQSDAATTDADGSYSFTDLPAGGDYTVKPSSALYDFGGASQTFDDLSGDVDASFAGTSLFYSLGGRVVDANNKPVSGVAVKLSGSRAATATTDASGNFLFADLPRGGGYALTPARQFYVFSPASQSFNNLTADGQQSFVMTRALHTLAGRVTEGGAGLAGATVTLSGAQAATATTDAAGNYSFANLPAGSDYTVTPLKTHYTFAPPSQTFAALDADARADFAATLNRHQITGRLMKQDGTGLAGAGVTLSGGQTQTATTDSNGAFFFTNLPDGASYTVTPALVNYTFAPASKSFDDLGADQAVAFTGTLNKYTLSGQVSDPAGKPLAGVTVALSGAQAATATTDAAGNYSFTNLPAAANYTVTASKADYTFAPASQTLNNLSSNQTVNFAGTLNLYTISGRVVDAKNAGLPGVAVALTGGQSATATTDAAGNFSFKGLPAGANYTATPMLAGYVFTPASQSFSALDADKTAAFNAALALFRIGGRVTEKGAGLPGVTVALDGTHPVLGPQKAQGVTAADGSYGFDLAAGGNYTVTPSLKDYTFDRASASFNNLSADQSADFAASHPVIFEFGAPSYTAGEGAGSLGVTVTRGGDTSTAATVTCTAQDGTAQQGKDLSTVAVRLAFAPGETAKSFTVFITDDSFVEGAESLTLKLTPGAGAIAGAQSTATLTINDNDTDAAAPNPVDDSRFFVRQHYLDFFNREPDDAGLQFWANNIESCGADSRCRAVKRADTSAAFFLSIEFQQTGDLVYRAYVASYGRMPRRAEEFLLDSRLVGDGVVVGQTGWQQKLEANTQAFFADFVSRDAFKAQYPSQLTPAQFVAALNTNTGGSLSADDSSAAAAEFGTASDSADQGARARALRRVVESRGFYERELNRAFVLMQYFGYLQRNPDDPPDADFSGYNFWLSKLNSFGGDYQKAEMVRAFIESAEYRGRFGK
jgi:protocatechuate 3,4-dioxygenase beta subunit